MVTISCSQSVDVSVLVTNCYSQVLEESVDR